MALEDVCVANVDLVGLVTVAASNAKLRMELGGDWRVAEYLVRAMCGSAKDRSADDLMILAGYSSAVSRGARSSQSSR